MASLLPINFLEDAANALGWAHCIFTSCCQLHQLGQLFVSIGIANAPDGPIALLAAAANGIALAHYFPSDAAHALKWAHSISCCESQCVCFSPLIFFWMLLMLP